MSAQNSELWSVPLRCIAAVEKADAFMQSARTVGLLAAIQEDMHPVLAIVAHQSCDDRVMKILPHTMQIDMVLHDVTRHHTVSPRATIAFHRRAGEERVHTADLKHTAPDALLHRHGTGARHRCRISDDHVRRNSSCTK